MNISKEERMAIRNIRENKNIIILPGDKGRAAVGVDTSVYQEKDKLLLSDKNINKQLK